ncbi:MAG: ATP-binding protein, partial [Planctomycetaceae bacterium]
DFRLAVFRRLVSRETAVGCWGAGFAIIMLAAMTGPVGTGLSTAEGRSEQLVPHVRKSAKLVLMIYGSHRIRGSGLGLAICRAIATVHGGKIAAANRPEGGARFTLRLPLSREIPSVFVE